MYTVKFTSDYKKSFKKIKKRGLDITLLNEVIDKLRRGKKLESKYKEHILTGKYKGFYECHIKPDWLLIYYFKKDVLVLTLVDTGTHSDLFDK
ncbi:MAG: type II toxin-antitoxin system YafQ family toxin [Coriobacteriia bacterium]|nr:type II toxin-antitoxin system YafQ family toxin [Coriobacteriia bacterium]MDO5329764.1 type II toxin-antitoxin system YafQ family toxin [Coriobacteriia bacterium]MDO5329798.1 type II toxin-antitoxin system YafQ family toxin [Coriobacteriia bacterium]